MRRSNASISATPAIHRNDGKTTSVGVHPCHSACFSGQYAASASPGVLTRIISAIVAPRKASREARRAGGDADSPVIVVDTVAPYKLVPCGIYRFDAFFPYTLQESVVVDPSPFDSLDLYETLQISPNADLDTIHRVYRLL